MAQATELPNVKTNTYYVVGIKGQDSYFSQDGYSKYNERYKQRISLIEQCKEQDLSEFVVYGYEQALDHIKELRTHVYEGKKHLENAEFEIRVTTTVTVIVPIKD